MSDPSYPLPGRVTGVRIQEVKHYGTYEEVVFITVAVKMLHGIRDLDFEIQAESMKDYPINQKVLIKLEPA